MRRIGSSTRKRAKERLCATHDSPNLCRRFFYIKALFSYGFIFTVSRGARFVAFPQKTPSVWLRGSLPWSCYRDSKPKRAKQPKNGIKHAVTPVKTERTATSWNDVPPSEASYAARRDGIRKREREQTPKARPLARQPAYPLVNSLT